MPGSLPKVSDFARLLAVAALAGCPLSAFAEKAVFASQVEPILSEKCYVCHGPVQQRGGLRLDRKESRLRAATIGPNGQSELLRRITSQEATVRMPPWQTSLGLSVKEIETLKAWVSEGATG